MNEEKIKELEKAVSKARFVWSQKAGAMHDLIEDRLPADYKEIPQYAADTFEACQEWDKLNQQLIEAKKQ